MKTVTTREAQHHLSKVLEMVDNGEEVVITRRGVEVALLSPIGKDNFEEQEVDWSTSVKRIEEHLKDMPDVGDSLAILERETYKW